MSKTNLLLYPDKRLRKISNPVLNINNDIRNIINDMFETMYYCKGIGLAAPQINIHKQIIVIDVSYNHKNRFVLINPKIIEKKDTISSTEGCLSIPNKYGVVLRAKYITITALDYNGNNFILKANNLLSICIQHEIDHLLGKLFIDHLSLFERKNLNIDK